ncbi:DoxX family protein [Pleurocapsales cyanobacterium LEGE 10410]|nr:DoxX family protein [Pleurocapsales cyanobacterium LEGE 10410]
MFDTNDIKDQEARDGLYAIDNYLSLLARIFLSAIFIWSGINKIMHPIATQENMSAHGMPLTSVFLAGAIALEILGGLSVLLGIKTRWGAAMLIIFLIPATLIFHTDFATELEQAMFLKNLAMLGGLLMLIQYGGGNMVLLKADGNGDRHSRL